MALVRHYVSKNNPPAITPAMQAELDNLKNIQDSDIDLSDAPEALDWSNAVKGFPFGKNFRRIKVDDDVAAWLDKKGVATPFDDFINQLLRKTMQQEQLV